MWYIFRPQYYEIFTGRFFTAVSLRRFLKIINFFVFLKIVNFSVWERELTLEPEGCGPTSGSFSLRVPTT